VITEEIAIQIFNSCHKGETQEAYAYGFSKEDISNNIINPVLISSRPDIYELVDDLSQDGSCLLWDAIAVTTQGWAAPIDPQNLDKDIDIPPSKHKNRKRVFLICIVTPQTTMHSVLQLEGEEPMYDTTGNGDLANALSKIYPKDKLTYDSASEYYI
jgi:hypothetical protein